MPSGRSPAPLRSARRTTHKQLTAGMRDAGTRNRASAAMLEATRVARALGVAGCHRLWRRATTAGGAARQRLVRPALLAGPAYGPAPPALEATDVANGLGFAGVEGLGWWPPPLALAGVLGDRRARKRHGGEESDEEDGSMRHARGRLHGPRQPPRPSPNWSVRRTRRRWVLRRAARMCHVGLTHPGGRDTKPLGVRVLPDRRAAPSLPEGRGHRWKLAFSVAGGLEEAQARCSRGAPGRPER